VCEIAGRLKIAASRCRMHLFFRGCSEPKTFCQQRTFLWLAEADRIGSLCTDEGLTVQSVVWYYCSRSTANQCRNTQYLHRVQKRERVHKVQCTRITKRTCTGIPIRRANTLFRECQCSAGPTRAKTYGCIV
jgi:hypothetical protein